MGSGAQHTEPGGTLTCTRRTRPAESSARRPRRRPRGWPWIPASTACSPWCWRPGSGWRRRSRRGHNTCVPPCRPCPRPGRRSWWWSPRRSASRPRTCAAAPSATLAATGIAFAARPCHAVMARDSPSGPNEKLENREKTERMRRDGFARAGMIRCRRRQRRVRAGIDKTQNETNDNAPTCGTYYCRYARATVMPLLTEVCARAPFGFPYRVGGFRYFIVGTNTFESTFARYGRSGTARRQWFLFLSVFSSGARRGGRQTHARAHTHTSGVRSTYACGVRVPRSLP